MKEFLLVFMFFLSCGLSYSQNDSYLKKLGVYNRKGNTLRDSILVNKINSASKDSMFTNSERALLFAREAYKIASSIEYFQGSSDALLNMSRAKIYLNEYDSAMYFADESLRLSKRINLKRGIVKAYEMRGNVYTYTEEYTKAVDEYFAAIQICDKANAKESITSYANLGLVFMRTRNTAKAREYTKKSLEMGRKYKDTGVVVTALNNLGLLEKNNKNQEQAKKYFEEGLELSVLSRNKKRESEILYNLANIYFRSKDYDKGFELFEKSVEISRLNGSYYSTAIDYHSMAMNYHEAGRSKEAAEAAEKAVEYALLSKSYEVIMETYAISGQIAYDRGKHADGFAFLSRAYVYKDSLTLKEINNSISEAEGKFEEEKVIYQAKMQRAQDKKISDEKLRSREVLLWISGGALVLVFVGIYLLFKRNRQVKAKNQIVEKQKAEIEEQHKEITDSIQYAKRIQNAMIASGTEWKKLSTDVSIYFNPRDVVSGDFYWVHNDMDRNLSIWAVADCTGHGIPGAFMSMLGIGFLNEIVIEGGCVNPGLILDRLRAKIISALENEDDESKDGMDISLCVWDRNTNELSYAGANNGLWLLRDEKDIDPTTFKSVLKVESSGKVIAEVGPDKMPIGKYFSVPPPFSTKKIKLQDEDTIILFTDGYADQFGGSDDKKFKYKQLKELLIDLNSKPFKEHPAVLGEKFQSWKGEIVQTDDVCIVSVKVSIS